MGDKEQPPRRSTRRGMRAVEQQNLSGISFLVVEVGAVASTGLFSLPYVPFVTGTHVFRVRIPGDPAHEGADSQTFSVTVKPNPGVINPEPAHNGTPPSEGH